MTATHSPIRRSFLHPICRGRVTMRKNEVICSCRVVQNELQGLHTRRPQECGFFDPLFRSFSGNPQNWILFNLFPLCVDVIYRCPKERGKATPLTVLTDAGHECRIVWIAFRRFLPAQQQPYKKPTETVAHSDTQSCFSRSFGLCTLFVIAIIKECQTKFNGQVKSF